MQISPGIVWGIIYFKFYPCNFSFSTFGNLYFEIITIFTGKYKLLEPQKRPHNPEVVGSSPASATKKVLKSYDFRTFSCALLVKKLKVKFGMVHFDPNLTPIAFLNIRIISGKQGKLQHSFKRFVVF